MRDGKVGGTTSSRSTVDVPRDINGTKSLGPDLYPPFFFFFFFFFFSHQSTWCPLPPVNQFNITYYYYYDLIILAVKARRSGK